MLRTLTRQISGWGQYPKEICHLTRPEKYRNLMAESKSVIARGQGRSYGDASLNKDNIVTLTQRLNRFLAFDKTRGILTCESGITLKEILDVIVPAQWFLPVTPGTQYASLGGCLASDVHGKNHHHTGTISKYVIAFELITAENKKILCTPQDQSALFWATLGGMGLTGIIGTIVLKLIPMPSREMIVCHHTANNLEQAFSYLSEPALDDEYKVAWIDSLNDSKKMGRGIIMAAHHAKMDEISPRYKRKLAKTINLPFNLPSCFLNSYSIKFFNDQYFNKQSQKKQHFIMDYQQYFYPLDNITHWNRLYGKKGFVQYQCVLPEEKSYEGIKQILQLQKLSFLAVLKKLGHQSQGFLSFPMPGYTLALDIPYRGEKTLKLLNAFDEIVLSHQGRIYLAKDAALSSDHFRQMYPKYLEWLIIKQKIDPENIFSSSLSRRLKIGE
jgi:decaprenylphospho-beta-D-ribofuranose 2-oxidase